MSVRTVYIALSAAFAFNGGLVGTAYAVYYIGTAHLDPLQLVLVGTALEAAYFVANVPTGAFADTHGRKRSVVIGVLLGGLTWTAQGLLPSFVPILIASAVDGIASAFVAGALEAWAAGEIGDALIGGVFVRSAQLQRVAGLAGIAASVGLATLGPGVPLVATAFVSIPAGVFLVFAMREHAFVRSASRTGWRDMAGTVRTSGALVRGRPLLVALFASSALVGAASEGFDRLSDVQLFRALPAALPLGPVFWFALARVGATFVGIAAGEVTRSRADGDDRSIATLLTIVESLRVASIVAFALANGFPLVVSARWAKVAFESASRPIYQAWLIRKVDPGVRATVLSMHSMCNAAGQITGGPAIGLVAAAVSVPAALVASAGFLLPNVAIYARQARLAVRPPIPVEVPL